jgi:hypothetical protein
VWFTYATLALLGAVVYIIGVPAMFLGILYKARRHNVKRLWRTISMRPITLSQWVLRAKNDSRECGRPYMHHPPEEEQKRMVVEFLHLRNLRYNSTRARCVVCLTTIFDFPLLPTPLKEVILLFSRLGFIYTSYTEHRWWYETFEMFRYFSYYYFWKKYAFMLHSWVSFFW